MAQAHGPYAQAVDWTEGSAWQGLQVVDRRGRVLRRWPIRIWTDTVTDVAAVRDAAQRLAEDLDAGGVRRARALRTAQRWQAEGRNRSGGQEGA